MRRSFSALVLALLAATAVTVPAQAHAELQSSTPASGAVLDAPPPQVELTFSDVIGLPDGDAITITGPDGTRWPVVRAAAVDRTITAKFDTAAAKPGAHTLVWKAKADDGDVVEGTIAFTMNVAAPASSAAAPSSVTMSAPVSNAPAASTAPEPGGVPLWVWVLAGLVVVVGAILLIRRRPAA
ncbi:copper resistance protein CopC [Lentzea sp. NPDC060358]|uniref:copper resistance CopC family protein n=1 Tax=Lentzea sp. NPDC060358 TaxID=3347103 RepID=UPI003661DA2D